MALYDGQGKGNFTPRASTPTDLGLISKEKFGLAAEETAPVSREQVRKDERISSAEGPFKWRTAQYDQGSGQSGESGPATAGGQQTEWSKDKQKVAGVSKSGIESASGKKA